MGLSLEPWIVPVFRHLFCLLLWIALGIRLPKTRVVIVQAPADTNPPAIMLLGAEFMEVGLGSTFQDPGATAVDAVDGVVDVVAQRVNIRGLYPHLPIKRGKRAVPATRVVEVVEPVDDVAPSLCSAVRLYRIDGR